MSEYQLLPLPFDRHRLCVGGLLSRCSRVEREGPWIWRSTEWEIAEGEWDEAHRRGDCEWAEPVGSWWLAGRKIRPARKPGKGECKGVCKDAQDGWLEKILSGEENTWKSCGNGSVAGGWGVG